MRFAPCPLLLILTMLPAHAALREGDRAAAEAVVAYGRAHLDAATGLVTDPAGSPNLPESSIGYVIACLETGQNLEGAKSVLGKLLALQQASGTQAGNFPWYAVAGATPGDDATLYLAPLLAYLRRAHAAALGEDLASRLQAALNLLHQRLPRISAGPTDDPRYLLRAGARAMVGAALDNEGAAVAVSEVAAWMRRVALEGLPQGHSPSFDTSRLLALKWIREVASDAQIPVVEQALRVVALDLAQRVDSASQYLAGAVATAFPADYASASGAATYVLHTDFGLPLPEKIDPYVMAALVPSWRTPESIQALARTGSPTMLRTRGPAPVRATDTYLGAGFSLGTMSGEVSGSTLPIFLTFGRTARPTAYFYCSPAPCAVQSVQAEGLSLSSFNFDGLATAARKQAWVRGVLGRPEDIEEVYCYGVKWNDLPTSLGEQESVAFKTRACYVGLTLARVGSAANQTGASAQPATLRWTGENRTGDLVLTVYARQADYVLPRPENNMRAGVIVEVAPEAAYLTLADFVKHLAEGRLKQTLRAVRQRVPTAEKPRDPNVLIPEPQAKIDMVFRNTLEQTSEYSLSGRSLLIVEDLIGNIYLQRAIDGKPLEEKYLWESDKLKLDPTSSLKEALAPYGG